jgi:hypothetical protein
VIHNIVLLLGDVRYDGTVTLGNLVSALTFLVLAAVAWTDLRWRIKNLEDWKTSHTSSSEKRDELIRKLDLANERLEALITTRQVGGRRFTDPQRAPGD